MRIGDCRESASMLRSVIYDWIRSYQPSLDHRRTSVVRPVGRDSAPERIYEHASESSERAQEVRSFSSTMISPRTLRCVSISVTTRSIPRAETQIPRNKETNWRLSRSFRCEFSMQRLSLPTRASNEREGRFAVLQGSLLPNRKNKCRCLPSSWDRMIRVWSFIVHRLLEPALDSTDEICHATLCSSDGTAPASLDRVFHRSTWLQATSELRIDVFIRGLTSHLESSQPQNSSFVRGTPCNVCC